ncbi:hypothetical protein C0389_00260 [bacterium]|nr:hypothetical protein [bacterium]
MQISNSNSSFRIFWNLLIGVVTTCIAVFYPVNLIFHFTSMNTLTIIEIGVTVIYAIDLFIWDSLNKSWHYEHFFDSLKHFGGNSRSHFLSDIISAFPFFLLFGSPFLLLFRLIKLVKVEEMLHQVRQWAVRYTGYITVLLFFFRMSLIAHWTSCIWLLLHGTDKSVDQVTNYVNALYFVATTLTTVGFGDILPITNSEKLFTVFMEVLGVLIYGYLIGNIVSIISKRNPAKVQFENNLERLSALSHYREISPDLRLRIRNYFLYVWRKKLGFDESEFLKNLPEGLKREVSLQLKKDILEKFTLFHGTDEQFLMEIALRLKPVVATPGEVIMKEGDIGNEMFFILKGELSFITGDKEFKILRDGDFFGEIALFKNTLRTASIRAETYSDLYSLDKTSFDFVVNKYPEFAVKIKEQARLRNILTDFMDNNSSINNNPAEVK